MTGRTVNFNDGHPDTDAGQVGAAGRLKDVRARMEQAAAAQRTGLIAVHTGSLEKERIRRETMATPIVHVAEVGGLSSKDHPQLRGLFRFKPSTNTMTAFLTAARTMLDAALEHKEELVPYGLSEDVVELFGQLLDQFAAAVKLGTDGRGQHMGATRELRALAKEARQIVRAMAARNRYRFKNDQQTLGAWIAASRVAAGPVTGSSPGDVPVPEPIAGPDGEQHGGTAEPGTGVRPAV